MARSSYVTDKNGHKLKLIEFDNGVCFLLRGESAIVGKGDFSELERLYGLVRQ